MARKPASITRRPLLIVVISLALAGLAPQVAEARCSGAGLRPSAATSAKIDRATLCLLNRQRSRHGLRRLRVNRRLSIAADRHARDMVRRHYFSHDSLGGSDVLDRLKKSRYVRSSGSWMIGENIAWGSGGYATPRSIVSSWMHSSGHRANILNRRFREVGLGVAIGAPERGAGDAATYVNDFGYRG